MTPGASRSSNQHQQSSERTENCCHDPTVLDRRHAVVMSMITEKIDWQDNAEQYQQQDANADQNIARPLKPCSARPCHFI
jgi:hypothetical protein